MEVLKERKTSEQRRILEKLRKVYPNFKDLSDDELIIKVDPLEFFQTKGVTNDMDRQFRKIRNQTIAASQKELQQSFPEMVEAIAHITAVIPELADASPYYLRYRLKLDSLADRAQKNHAGLQGFLNCPLDDGEQDQTYDICKLRQRQGFPLYMKLLDTEYNLLKSVRDNLKAPDSTATGAIFRELNIDAYSQTNKVGTRKRQNLQQIKHKLYRPTPEHATAIANYFGADPEPYCAQFATPPADYDSVESAIIEALLHLPLSKRIVLGQAIGLNMRRINQKVIAKAIGVTESRISQLIKEVNQYIKSWLTAPEISFLKAHFTEIELIYKMPRLAEIFDTKKYFFRFLGDLAEAPARSEIELSTLQRNAIYDALAHWGPRITLQEFERYMMETYGKELNDLYYMLLTTDLIDDSNLVIKDGTITVLNLPSRYLIGAIASRFVDGVETPQLLAEIEKSPLYVANTETPLAETFRKSQYLYTLDKSFYKHVRYYDPNDRELQVVIRQMFPIIREPKPDHITTIYDLYNYIPKAQYISQYLFCFVFRQACETVDFDIHPSYFEFVQKPAETVADDKIIKLIRKNRRAASRNELLSALPFDMRYLTMRLSQLVRSGHIIRVTRETYDLRDRALKNIDVTDIKGYIVAKVTEEAKIVDFSYLTKLLNRDFKLQRKIEFYHSLYVQDMKDCGLYVNRYLLSPEPIPFTSLRDMVNRIFDPTLSDRQMLTKIHDTASIARDMDATIQQVWLYQLRYNEQRRKSLKAAS